MDVSCARAVLINDSSHEEIAGDVYLFRDKTTAAGWLEPIDVQSGGSSPIIWMGPC